MQEGVAQYILDAGGCQKLYGASPWPPPGLLSCPLLFISCLWSHPTELSNLNFVCSYLHLSCKNKSLGRVV